jgi:dynactin complex subunit
MTFSIGDRVALNDGRLGVVRYFGPVMFGSGGLWVGMELDLATGKNNGSVEGYYFSKMNFY